MMKSDSIRTVTESNVNDHNMNMADVDDTLLLDDESLAAKIFEEGKQVLVELSTDPKIIEVDDSELLDRAAAQPSMMRSLSFRVTGLSRFGPASPATTDLLHIEPTIDEETEVEETEQERLTRERIQEENRKLEKIKKEIRKKEIELLRVYEIGKRRTREYRQTENAHIRDKNAAGRSLWMTRKSHRMNLGSGAKDYKNQMFKVSLPCHDTSNSTLATEGKLLKADYTYRILDHQIKLLHHQQHTIIGFLHKGVIKEAVKDRDQVISKLKEQVQVAVQKQEEWMKAYEAVMMAQGDFIDHLRLHLPEEEQEQEDSSTTPADDSANKEEKQEKQEKPGFKDFKSTKLRRSAELRIEAKFGSLKERQAKKEIRNKVFQETLENVEEIERGYLERAKNVTGQIDSVLSSIQVKMETEELTEHPDENEHDEEEEGGGPVVDVDSSSASVNDETKNESSISHTLDASFKAEEEEEVSEHNEDDSHTGSHNDSSSVLSVSDDHSQSSAARRRRIDEKDKKDISSRLEKLRAKRRQQEQQHAERMSTRRLGSSRRSGDKASATSRREELLEKAKSARSSRLVDQSILSPRTKENKMKEIRERRQNRVAGAAAAIPPATIAEGS